MTKFSNLISDDFTIVGLISIVVFCDDLFWGEGPLLPLCHPCAPMTAGPSLERSSFDSCGADEFPVRHTLRSRTDRWQGALLGQAWNARAFFNSIPLDE